MDHFVPLEGELIFRVSVAVLLLRVVIIFTADFTESLFLASCDMGILVRLNQVINYWKHSHCQPSIPLEYELCNIRPLSTSLQWKYFPFYVLMLSVLNL